MNVGELYEEIIIGLLLCTPGQNGSTFRFPMGLTHVWVGLIKSGIVTRILRQFDSFLGHLEWTKSPRHTDSEMGNMVSSLAPS